MRQFAPLLLIPIAVVLVAVGYEQYSITEDVFGDVYHPQGSLGVALMVTGLVIGYWGAIALAQPSWFARLGTLLRTSWRSPRRLLISGFFVGGLGLGLVSVTDTAGDTVVYHPFDLLGIEVMLIGLGLVIAGVWRIVGRARATAASLDAPDNDTLP
jgi:hypothetical protein